MATRKPTPAYQSQRQDFNFAAGDEFLASLSQPGGDAPAEPRGMARAAADTGLSFGRGAVQGVRMLTDLAGADNAVSGGLRSVEDYISSLKSAEAQADERTMVQILRDAEGKGLLDQVVAGFRAFGVAPVQTLAQAVGTSIPTVATALIPGAGPAAAAGRMGAALGIGAGQGAGAVKSSIYDEVLQAQLAAGKTPEEAQALAAQAQAYGGPNAGQIALGAGLGAWAGRSGIEAAADRLVRGTTRAAPGMARRVGIGAAAEGVPEALQGGQEKFATNTALANEGFDVDPMAGVVASGTMEALAGAAMGGALGTPRPAMRPGDQLRADKLPEVGPMSRAVNAAVEAAAKKADAGEPLPPEPMQDMAAPGAPTAEQPADPGQPAEAAAPAAQPPAIDFERVLANMHALAAEEAQSMRQFGGAPAPAAPMGPVTVIGPEPVQRPSPDILNPKGEPFRNLRAAQKARAAQSDPGAFDVVPVDGGFVVRPTQGFITDGQADADAQPGALDGAAVPGDRGMAEQRSDPAADAGDAPAAVDRAAAGGDADGVRPGDDPAPADAVTQPAAEPEGGNVSTPAVMEAPAAPPADADVPTLKKAWSDAVQRGDTVLATQINDRIVAAKGKNAPAPRTEPEAPAEQAPAPAGVAGAAAAPAAVPAAGSAEVEADGVAVQPAQPQSGLPDQGAGASRPMVAPAPDSAEAVARAPTMPREQYDAAVLERPSVFAVGLAGDTMPMSFTQRKMAAERIPTRLKDRFDIVASGAGASRRYWVVPTHAEYLRRRGDAPTPETPTARRKRLQAEKGTAKRTLQEQVERPAAPDAVVATAGDPEAKGERKFYVTMVRGDRVARLAGPFDTKEEAEAMKPRAQDEANKADPRSAFDAFGVSGITSENHKPGTLNERLGIGAAAVAEREAAPAPAAEQEPQPNPFAEYDALARQYGYEVRPDGSIGSDGKFPGVKMRLKAGRLRIEGSSGDLLGSYAPKPASLGTFLERFWYAEKKTPAASEPTPQPAAEEAAAPAEAAQQWNAMIVADRSKMLDAYFGAGQSDAGPRYASRTWDSFTVGEKSTLTAAMGGGQANDRDSFTLQRLNRETGQMEPVTFQRGEYVQFSVGEGGPRAFGDIDGISQVRKEFSVDGLWHPFGFANKAERPAPVPKRDTVPLSSVIDKVNKKFGAGLTEADRIPEPVNPLDAESNLWQRISAGKATPDEFKAGFQSWLDNKAAIMEAMSKLKKDELLKMGGSAFAYRYKSENKPTIVDALWRDGMSSYALGRGYSYGMSSGNSQQDAVRAMVNATGADELAQYAADRKAAEDEAVARAAKMADAIKDPKTLDDYKTWMRATMTGGKTFKEARMMLTPEQRAAFDDLAATESRSQRRSSADEQRTQVRVAGQTVDGDIIATKHTKKGTDLFVVRLAERVSREDYDTLNAGAKRIGGYYSSYRGGGAIPGFQFTTREQAQAFVTLAGGDNTAAVEAAKERRDAYADDRSQSAAERLAEMADRMEADAEESLGLERKANTARRARFAAAAEAGARNLQAMAKTMRNVSQALASGRAKFLDRIRTRTQVELLQTYVATAKGDQLRAKYPTYAEQEKRKGEPPDAETADYAEFPTFTAFRSDLASLGRQLQEVEGTKKLGDQIMRVADDVSDAFTAWTKEPGNFSKVATFTARDTAGGIAGFSTKDGAERAIARSGYRGKAIPWNVKRGQWTVIMSPSEAMARGLWTGDGDKRITLDADFGAELVEKMGRANRRGAKVSVPWQFERAAERRKALARMGLETPAEFRAALREFISLREQAQEADRVKMLERAMVGKGKDGLDFFPTPASVADEMVAAAGIEPDMAVLEPSAGMGHIADRIRAAGAEPDVVEMAGDRRELLQEKGYTVQASDFLSMKPREFFTWGDVFRAPDGTEGVMMGGGGMGSSQVMLRPLKADGTPDMRLGSWHNRDELVGVRHRGVNSGYDRIIMNPPFSDGRDIEHVRHAYTLLKPGGRIVALMGESAFTNQNKRATEFREWLERLGGTDEKLPDGSFMDPSLPVNTGANARMVVIEKDGDDPALKRGTATGSLDLDSARALAAQMAERGMVRLNVVQSVADMPARQRDKVLALDPAGQVRGAYFRQGDSIWMVADNIRGADEFVRIAFHEAFHRGLARTIPEAKAVLREMWRTNQNLRAATAAQMKAHGIGQDEAIEEALAVMAEAGTVRDLKGWSKLMEMIRSWVAGFAKALGLEMTWTDDMVLDFVAALTGRGLQGGVHVNTGQGTAAAPATDAEPAADGPMLARTADALRDTIPEGVQQWMTDRTTSQRGFNRVWHRTVGTQLHKAKINKDFGRVYYAVQDFMKDVSRIATLAADKAPDMLPQIESLGDLARLAPTLASPAAYKQRKADIQAASAALFDGTLRYTRDEEGKAVKVEPDSDELGGIVWTDAELRERGLSDRAVKMYRQSRQAIDQSLENMLAADLYRQASVLAPEMLATTPGELDALLAGMRRAAASENPGQAYTLMRNAIKDRLAELETALDGQPNQHTPDLMARRQELRKLQTSIADKAQRIADLQDAGYAPLMRFGPYAVDAVNADGRRVFFGMYESQAAANKAARNFRGDGLQVTQSIMPQKDFEALQGVSPETALLFAEMLGVEKNEAMQKWLQNAVAEQSALKRHIRRKGIEGFDEDGGRVLAAFVTSNARAASRALHAARMADAVENVQQGDVKDEARALVEYVNNPKEEAQALRGLLFVQYIGGSIASAMVNLTQTLVQTLPYLSQYGGAIKAGARLSSAMKTALADKIADPALAKAVARAEKDGVIKPQEVFQLQAEASRSLGSNLYARSLLAAWGSMFQLAEQFNRRTAFIAAYETARQQGMADPFAFAENAVDETQSVFNKGNRPTWARGAVGSTLFTFKTFTIQYLEFLKRLATAGEPGSPERAQGRKAAALALLTLVMLSGMKGLPFADDADDLIDTVAQGLGYNWTTDAQRDKWLDALLGETFSDLVQHGFSGMPGVPFDVSQRLGMANLLPGTGLLKTSESNKQNQVLEVFGVAGSAVRDTLEALPKALTGDLAGAMKAGGPVAIRNLMQGLDIYETGLYRDRRGRNVTEADMVDAVLKGIGLQPSNVARAQREIGRQIQQRSLYQAVKEELTDAMAQARFDGDDAALRNAQQALARWNDSNPEARIIILPQTIRQRLRQMRMSKAERTVANTPRPLRAQTAEALQ